MESKNFQMPDTEKPASAMQFHVPESKHGDALAYSARLHKNHPSWNAQKVARKVAEKYGFKRIVSK